MKKATKMTELLLGSIPSHRVRESILHLNSTVLATRKASNLMDKNPLFGAATTEMKNTGAVDRLRKPIKATSLEECILVV
jgi:hypothetical protein